MKQYIGTKIIQAEPGWCCIMSDGKAVFHSIFKNTDLPSSNHQFGYQVVYPDGYVSWSPKDVFEQAYRETDGMNFGLALEAAKLGHKIARRGWNGKSQYVELADCISYRNFEGKTVNADHQAIGNKALAFVGTSGVQMGWLASQSDMLAEDWYLVD